MPDQPPIPPGGGTPPPGGAGTGEGGGDPKPGSTVPYDTYRQLLDEKKKASARVAELEGKISERESKDLEAQGDFQKLLVQEREKNEKLTRDLSEFTDRESNRRKLASVLGALQGNVEPKYFDLIPYAEVLIDPTGEVDQLSVAKVVEKVRQKYPEIIKAQSGPGMPTAHPQGGTSNPATIKRSEWLKLASSEMRKWKPAQVIAD